MTQLEAYEYIQKGRANERAAVIADIEGWLDDWIKRNGVEVGIELGLRAKLGQMKGGNAFETIFTDSGDKVTRRKL